MKSDYSYYDRATLTGRDLESLSANDRRQTQVVNFSNQEISRLEIKTLQNNCRRQEESAILISRLLLRMRCMYVAGIRLYLH